MCCLTEISVFNTASDNCNSGQGQVGGDNLNNVVLWIICQICLAVEMRVRNLPFACRSVKGGSIFLGKFETASSQG